jgi:hypothetical protein
MNPGPGLVTSLLHTELRGVVAGHLPNPITADSTVDDQPAVGRPSRPASKPAVSAFSEVRCLSNGPESGRYVNENMFPTTDLNR